jgi:hypothetical protein
MPSDSEEDKASVAHDASCVVSSSLLFSIQVLELSDTKVYAPLIRAHLGDENLFCKVDGTPARRSHLRKGVLKPVSLKSIHPQIRQLNFITRNSKE